MSCRNTPSGSLATTYVQRLYGLTDRQCTSLYHELVRQYRIGAVPVTVSRAEFNATLDAFEHEIRSNTAWSPARREAALARVGRARDAGPPADPARLYAFTRISERAQTADRQIMRTCEMASRITGEPVAQLRQRFQGLAGERGSHEDGVATAPTGLPQDTGTRRAFAQIRAAVATALTHSDASPDIEQARCPACQQFVSATGTHDCPGSADDGTSTPDMPSPGRSLAEPMSVETFQDLYDKARENLDSGATRTPTFPNLEAVPGGVTGGLAHPDTGLSFGIELEIDFPDEPPGEWGTARDQLAGRLYEEGLVMAPHVARWHFVGGEGENRPGGTFQVRADGWACEFDRSVDGVDGERGVEIKSQILYDTPQTWANLRRICEIAESLGGRATPRCGTHVNIDSAYFDSNDPATHTNLIRLANAYDDVLLRLAHNPESGPQHRGRTYCGPAWMPPAGYDSVREARDNSGHYQAFNFAHLPDEYTPRTSTSRVEVRLFDSSLDPGRIQTQVATCLALVAAARNGRGTDRDAEPAGSHRSRYRGRRLEGDEWVESTESFRHLLGLVAEEGLSRPEHQQQLVHLFAASKWQAG